MKVRFDCPHGPVILELPDAISSEDRKLIEEHLDNGLVYSKGRSPDGKRRIIKAKTPTVDALIKAIKEDDEQTEARQRYEEACRLNNVTPEPAD
jgi:hypothetical protein